MDTILNKEIKNKDYYLIEELLLEKEYEFENYFDYILDLYYNILEEYAKLGFLNKSNFTDFYNIILDNIILDVSINNIVTEFNDDYSSDHSVEE